MPPEPVRWFSYWSDADLEAAFGRSESVEVIEP